MKPLIGLLMIIGSFAVFHPAVAQTWTQTSAPNTNWTSIASSADGTKLAAADFGGIWVSTNSGTTWTQTSAPREVWTSIASSADGSKLIAGASQISGLPPYYLLYISTDSGNTWTTNNIPNQEWSCVASSADGSKLVALSGEQSIRDVIFTSTNSGNSWVSTNLNRIESVASSADGNKLVAVGSGFGIYISTNSGGSWTPTNSLHGALSIASSANGNCLVACDAGIVVSTNSGMTWTLTSAPETNWISVASSADGSRLVAVAAGSRYVLDPVVKGPIYTSTNCGMTWTSNNVPAQYWSSVASSADGGKLAAVVGGGGIWVSQTTPPPQLNLTPLPTNLAFSWTIPSANFVLQQSSNLTSWADLTNAPALNLTNLQNEVILLPSNSSGFYRLKIP